MQVTISELSPVEKKVAVEIPWPYVEQKLDEAYRDLGRGVALKGFRKGKVPRPILEKMFGRQIEQEVVKQLVQESFVAAANEHQIQPVAEPVVDDAHLHKGKSFHYSARVEVRSEVEPKDYDGVPLNQRPAHVSDDEVVRALERKRQELTEYKVIEPGSRAQMVTTDRDVVVLSLKGAVGPEKVDKDGLMLDLSDRDHDPVPGLLERLVGLPLDASDRELSWDVPAPAAAEGDAKEAAGPKKAQLKVTIKEAREKHMPALDDEFAKDTGEADTLSELKDKTKQKLLQSDEKNARMELRSDLVKELLKRNSFVVAPALVERQLDALVYRAKMQMAVRGLDVRPSAPGASELDQRLRDELRESANDEVRAAFLIEAVAKKEKVEVSDAEFEKRLAEMAKERDKSVQRLKAELQKEERLESLRYQLREEKTLDLLLSRAKITEKAQEVPTTPEETK